MPAGNDTRRPGGARRREAWKRHLDEKLDAALDETFPASDPIELTPDEPEPPDEDEDRPSDRTHG